MEQQSVAYIMLSGGIDSATALYLARHRGHRDIRCVSFHYGQRHSRELESAAGLALAAGAEHTVIQLRISDHSMLTDATIPVPDISYSEIEGVSPTFVPFRNGLMLSRLAAHITDEMLNPLADSEHQSDALIYWGAHAEDSANWAYPDCTPEFIGAMACAIYIGTYSKVRLTAPFQSMFKHEIIELGVDLDVPYELTWSCYKGGERQCGTCATCRARRDAFRAANVPDPTSYAAAPAR